MKQTLLILFITGISLNLTAQNETEIIPDTLETDTIVIGYSSAAPFIITDNGPPEGISIWLWEQIAKDLNLDYRFVRMNFGDILLALEKGSIDLCINPLTITSDRHERMDFTHSFYASYSTIVIHHLSPIKKFWQFIQSFFSVNFWRAFLFLVSLIIFFGLLAWFFERKVNPEQFRTGYKGIWDGMWWSVVTMTTVGYGDKFPKSREGKFVALIWMFSGLLFISGLTASVASTLTVNQLNWNPVGFSDFKDRPVGTVAHTSTDGYLKNRFFKKVSTFDSVTEGYDKLLHHELDAFMYDEPILRYNLMKDEKYTHLEILPARFDLQFYAFGIPKDNNALRDVLSQKILEYTEKDSWKVVLAEYGVEVDF